MKRKALLIGLIFAISSSIQSQSVSSITEIKADNSFAKKEYRKAAKLYHKVYDKVHDKRIILKLARLYHEMGQTAIAYTYYQQVIDKKYLTNSVDLLRFAELAKVMNRPEQAEVWVNRYLSINPRNERAQNLLYQLQISKRDLKSIQVVSVPEVQESSGEGTLLTINTTNDSKLYVLTDRRVIEVMSLSADNQYNWLEQLLLDNDIEITNTVDLNPIIYQSDQVFMDKHYQQELDKLAKLMQQYQYIEFEISAHADASGSEGYNKSLSQSRANAARDFLLTRDIQLERLLAVGYGENDPVFECHESSCTHHEARLNRRMEFRLVYLNRNQIVSN